MKIKVNDIIEMRSLTVADASEVFSVIDKNREYLREWLPWVDGTVSSKITEEVILSWEKEAQNVTDIVFGIFKHNKHIGTIGLHDLKMHNNSGMIGYWLAENKQGGGIMTGCVKSLINYGFETLNLNRIYIHCASPNTKSQAIPERLGFVKEGVLRDGECLYGKYFDLFVYGMLRRDWQKQQ